MEALENIKNGNLDKAGSVGRLIEVAAGVSRTLVSAASRLDALSRL